LRGLDIRIPDAIGEKPTEKAEPAKKEKGSRTPADAPKGPPAEARKKKDTASEGARNAPAPGAMGAESMLRTGRTEASVEEEEAADGEPELADAVEATAEAEEGEGEPVCAYGVEVVELLEMEPIDEHTRRPRRKVPWNRYASAVFAVVFVLGVLNAAASLLYSSGTVSPAEVFQSSTCEVAGEVRDVAGHPVPNAKVVVTDSSRSASTNRDGWYVIKGLSPGPHRVEATAEGFNNMSVRTDLQPNLLNTIDFTLEKGARDVQLDESSAPDFDSVGTSYLWAIPLLVVFSVCALLAAIYCIRRPGPSRVTLALGALGILSFGFGAGSVLAIAGTLLAAMPVAEGGALPLKKLRVGVSYPSREPVASQRPKMKRTGDESGLEPRSYGEYDRTAAVEEGKGAATKAHLEPVTPPEGGALPLEPVPLAEGAAPALRPVPPAEAAADGVEAAKPPPLKDKTAESELDGPAAPRHERVAGRARAGPVPKRFVRRSTKGTLRCFTCMDEIHLGSEYIKCVCGKTVHVHCLEEPRCPGCGQKFGRPGKK